MQTIGLIDGLARLREFVAAFREKGLMAVHDRAAARDDRPEWPPNKRAETTRGEARGPGESDERGAHRPGDGAGGGNGDLCRAARTRVRNRPVRDALGSHRIWFGGVALAIVLLVPRTGPAWQIAFHRFVEVP